MTDEITIQMNRDVYVFAVRPDGGELPFYHGRNTRGDVKVIGPVEEVTETKTETRVRISIDHGLGCALTNAGTRLNVRTHLDEQARLRNRGELRTVKAQRGKPVKQEIVA